MLEVQTVGIREASLRNEDPWRGRKGRWRFSRSGARNLQTRPHSEMPPPAAGPLYLETFETSRRGALLSTKVATGPRRAKFFKAHAKSQCNRSIEESVVRPGWVLHADGPLLKYESRRLRLRKWFGRIVGANGFKMLRIQGRDLVRAK